MLYFLISCVSFILLSNSLPPWEAEKKLLSPLFWGKLSSFLVSWFKKSKLSISFFQLLQVPKFKPFKKMSLGSRVVVAEKNVEEKEDTCLLDLPELALECILDRLSPAGLCSMAAVCTSMRDRCRSDHLWEKRMKQKWGRVIGDAAYREWQWQLATRKRPIIMDQSKKNGLLESLLGVWPFSIITPKLESSSKSRSSLPVDSTMAWYLSLQSGKLSFPAQVYNRENNHVGFMLSCYDAHLSYDSKTDTFLARYSPHVRRTTEESIRWDRLRAPPVDTPPHVLHVSDCLNDLTPGDHIEIQWRRNKEFPYGWWYGIIGHLESCDGNENHCRCNCSNTVILEFNQYTSGSRWRRMVINRKDHREKGNEADGFYGGIRKLSNKDEIARWKRLWPTQVLE